MFERDLFGPSEGGLWRLMVLFALGFGFTA
jgi:hypothetical protein